MEYIYSENFSIRNSDFSYIDLIKPQSILEIAEEIAGRHAEKLNIGYETLKKRNLAWVCVRSKFEIVSNLRNGENAIVETYPSIPGKIDMDRNYIIKDLSGNIKVRGTTKWILIDFNTRRIQRVNVIDYPYNNDSTSIIPNMSKVVINEDVILNNRIDFKVLVNDLDHNGHVNNARYVEHVYNTFDLEETRIIESFEVEYVKELKYNELAYLLFDSNKENYKIYNELNELSFVMKIKWRNK